MVLSGVSWEKSPVTQRGKDPGTVRQVTQRLNHYATPGPNTTEYMVRFYLKTNPLRPFILRLFLELHKKNNLSDKICGCLLYSRSYILLPLSFKG